MKRVIKQYKSTELQHKNAGLFFNEEIKMDTSIASCYEDYYNKEQVERLVASAISAALHVSQPQNLDNDMVRDSQISHIDKQEGEITMPSRHQESYTYTSKSGEIRTIRLSGASKADTDLSFQEFLSNQHIASCPTLREFVMSVYYDSFISNLSPNTIMSYDNYLKNYIFPFLGDMQMSLITVSTIQQFYDYMASGKSHGFRNDLNHSTIERVSGLCSRIFKVAIEMDIVASTPFRRTLLRNRGKNASHHRAIPEDIVKRVRESIPLMDDSRKRLYMGLLCYTGLRREEILGMRWENLDLESACGEVHCVIVYPGNNLPVLKDTPKTKSSERTFILPDSLIQILSKERLDSGFVIHSKTPEDALPFSTAQRLYRNCFKELGISEYNNHDWRATYATELKESGLTSAQVADLLGHADTRMVETTYARARKEGIMKHKNFVNSVVTPETTSDSAT